MLGKVVKDKGLTRVCGARARSSIHENWNATLSQIIGSKHRVTILIELPPDHLKDIDESIATVKHLEVLCSTLGKKSQDIFTKPFVGNSVVS